METETPTPPVGQSATAWARENGTHHRYRAALDNYEPAPRAEAFGDLFAYPKRDEPGTTAYVLDGRGQFRDATGSAYLIDNGRTVCAYYVAAFHPDQDSLILHPFPTNYTADGSPRVRPDGRPVDMGGWMLGPRRTYHLKLI